MFWMRHSQLDEETARRHCAPALLAATVDKGGPLNSPNAESLLVASSFGQATIAFRHVLRLLEPTLERYPKLLKDKG